MALTWATGQTITQLTAVNQTEQLSTALDLLLAYTTLCEVKANSSGTPTDPLIINIYLSNDNSAYDDQPWSGFSYEPGSTSTEQMTVSLPAGLRYVKFGFASGGATDTYVVDMDYQRLTAV